MFQKSLVYWKMASIKDIKIDLNELEKEKKKNFEERLKFIDWWVDYMKRHSDKDWSEDQNKVIDSQFKKI
mgnify:CR=1 FL=1